MPSLPTFTTVPTLPTLTTVILTKNSAAFVEPLLKEAAAQSDQVILLDDLSEDDIASLGKKYQAKLVSRALNGDFAAQRNAVFPTVTSDWTLFLDADELPIPEFWTELKAESASDRYDAFFVKRRSIFLGKALRFGEAGETLLLRAARTSVGAGKWQRPVHEVWRIPDAKTKVLENGILHQQPPSIAAFFTKLNTYADLEQETRSALSVWQFLWQLLVYPPGKFVWNMVFRQAWRDGFPGFALAWCMSYYSAIERILQYEKSL